MKKNAKPNCSESRAITLTANEKLRNARHRKLWTPKKRNLSAQLTNIVYSKKAYMKVTPGQQRRDTVRNLR